MKRILLARSLQGSIKHYLAFALLILLHITVPGQAQEAEAEKGKSSEIAYGFETDFNSRDVFRGLAYSRGPVNQSTAWMAVSGFTFYTCGNFVLNREPHQREFTEIDFGVSYEREWKKLTVEPAFDYYRYRTPVPVKDPPTGEASLKLTYQIGPARAFTKQTFDIGSYRSAYLGEAGLAYEHTLNRKIPL